MLNLHFSNRFETLADQLVRRLGHQAAGRSAFEADEVIVPSAAITRRLIIELARAQGICANVRFSYLAGWLWQHTAHLMPDLPESARFDADVFAWRILAAFEDAAWSHAQPRLCAWLAQADPVMRHELAVQVAGLFDQYLTYRPEWLEAWFRNETITLPGSDDGATLDQQWQASLWRRLAAETASDGRHPILALLELLDAHGINLAGTGRLPASAHVFCLPTMPPVHLELLRRLGTHIDLHLYVLNPSREFWFDVVEPRRLAWLSARGQAQYLDEGNRLLAAWGQQTQSALSLLVDAASDGIVEDAQFVATGAGTVLGALQDAMLALTELAPGSLAPLADDRSIEVHVCHSLTRELEVLHDRLLALMAGPNPPQPGDILVVTPDLDAAAPLVDAVFGTAPRERHLPYAISGRARAQVNAPARALLDVLALVASRFAVNDVFGLLQQPVVARRFGLAEDALDQIREWLVQAGIHWALDAQHRGGFDVPAQPRHSFADGLDRLFLGYALPAHLQTPFQGRLPAGNAEGSGALTLGTFWRFVDTLKSLRERVATPRRPADWPALLADALRDFIAPDAADLEYLRDVDEAIARLAEQWRLSGLQRPLALDVVRAALATELDDPARGGVPTGMITFAAMSSLRNVPFRVVCAIGLDDGAFPTSARPAEFDLMTLAPRRGDRQRRVDERNVFLDLLLAARERVHLSYAGRSVRDNSVRPASVLVAELLESLLPALASTPASAASRAQARAALVIEHPLQPFAVAAFDVATPDQRLRSYQADYAEALRQSLAVPVAAASVVSMDDDWEAADDDTAAASAAPFIARPLAPVDDTWRDVPLARLAAFFRNPCRFLLEQRLGVALRRNDDELQDDEPFVPDNSGRAPLTRLLLPALLAGLPPEAARTLALAGTAVPAGGFGKRFLERELNGLHDFAEQVREHIVQPVLPPHAAVLTFAIDGLPWRLHANFGDLRPRGLLHHRYAKQGVNDYLDSWLPHLLLCASAPAGVLPVTTGIARDGRFFLTECEQPVAALQTLVRLYAQGLREPLAFFPRAAWEWINGDRQGPSKAIAAFRPGGFNEYAEGNDAAYRLALRGRPDPFSPEIVGEFYANALAVFEPLLACLERE
ncbi:MAG: exodeoxyribonuclease V subunit gamma [Burkholderiaceae bacterium]